MADGSLPPYVDIGSKQVFAPPYTAAGVSMFGVLVKSDNPAALQDYCDRAFNRPSGGKFAYRPFIPYLLLTFADIKRLYSTNPPDLDVGWDPERDVVFWLLMVDANLSSDAPLLTFCVPFIFVNNPQAVLTGREVHGFPKEFATVGMMPGETIPMPFTVVANVYPQFNRDTEVVWANVLTLRPQADDPSPPTRWTGLEDALADVASVSDGGLKLLLDMGMDLLKLQGTCIFLKQFPDAHDGSRACYQAIVQTAFTPRNFRGGGLLAGRYELLLQHYDSHPFARDLGLTQNRYSNLWGTWLNFDFDLELGTVIWQA